MGKNKLKKFAEMKSFRCVVEAPEVAVTRAPHPLRGKWAREFFSNSSPLCLELGCGKGEYTVALASRNPAVNYIGVDIKGARIYTGARQVEERGIHNAGFLRTQVESLPLIFGANEVEELWITFPDPQLKKVNKRLTGTRFLSYYRSFLAPGAIVNLKTDSPFLYEYTRRLAVANDLEILDATDDLYAREGDCLEKEVKTFYEQQWLARGKSIRLLKFRIGSSPLVEPDVSDLEPDDYRAAARFNRS